MSHEEEDEKLRRGFAKLRADDARRAGGEPSGLRILGPAPAAMARRAGRYPLPVASPATPSLW